MMMSSASQLTLNSHFKNIIPRKWHYLTLHNWTTAETQLDIWSRKTRSKFCHVFSPGPCSTFICRVYYYDQNAISSICHSHFPLTALWTQSAAGHQVRPNKQLPVFSVPGFKLHWTEPQSVWSPVHDWILECHGFHLSFFSFFLLINVTQTHVHTVKYTRVHSSWFVFHCG